MPVSVVDPELVILDPELLILDPELCFFFIRN
jgi:hypothetical protein